MGTPAPCDERKIEVAPEVRRAVAPAWPAVSAARTIRVKRGLLSNLSACAAGGRASHWAAGAQSNDRSVVRSGLPVGLSAHFAMSTVRASMLSHQRQLSSVAPVLDRMGTRPRPQPVQQVMSVIELLHGTANSATVLSLPKLARALWRRSNTVPDRSARSGNRRYSNPS